MSQDEPEKPILDYWGPVKHGPRDPYRWHPSPVAAFLLALSGGVVLSGFYWCTFAKGASGGSFGVAVAIIIALKIGIAVAMHFAKLRGAAAGIIVSIPLVPLIAFGTVWVICGGPIV